MGRKSKTPVGSRRGRYPESVERIGVGNPLDGITQREDAWVRFQCVYRDDAHGVFLYEGDCLEVLDAIAAKHPDGCFDMIFADPPYCRP